jgi:hypothetical protein
MIIDCHYHLEERLLTINELIKKMNEAGVEKTALMGQQVEPYPEPPRFLIKLLHPLLIHRPLRRIGKFFIANFTLTGIKILGKEYALAFDPDNGPVFDAVKQFPDRFFGWIFVNPCGRKDPVAEFEKWRKAKGCVGVKAHCFWNHHTPLTLMPVAEKAAEAGLPLIVHLGYGPEGDYKALLNAFPKLKLIFAHAAFPEFADTWQDIKSRKNVFVDLSQTSYINPGIIRSAVNYLGADRCIFGTDGPYGFHGKDGKFDYGLIKRWIEALFTDSGIKLRLLGENFLEITGVQ